MSKVCEICGKGKMSGAQLSFSHSHLSRRTNKKYEANLQQAVIDVDGKPTKVKACTKCIKTSKKAK